jgi:hypothetical protein
MARWRSTGREASRPPPGPGRRRATGPPARRHIHAGHHRESAIRSAARAGAARQHAAADLAAHPQPAETRPGSNPEPDHQQGPAYKGQIRTDRRSLRSCQPTPNLVAANRSANSASAGERRPEPASRARSSHNGGLGYPFNRSKHLRGSALGFRNFTTTSPDHSWKPAASDSGYTRGSPVVLSPTWQRR